VALKAIATGFVLRTPLLPLHVLTTLSEGLRTPSCADDGNLEDASHSDRSVVIDRLHQMFQEPLLREALWLASPSLQEEFQRWSESDCLQRKDRIPTALYKYLARMTMRSTPFGLFAGVTCGTIGKTSLIELHGRSNYRRATRLDVGFLWALAHSTSRLITVRDTLRFCANRSIYFAAGRIHYYARRFRDGEWVFELVAVERTPHLCHLLERSQWGIRTSDLISSLMEFDHERSRDEISAFVDLVIEEQVLEPELLPACTGRSPIEEMILQLGDSKPAEAIHAALAELRQHLNSLDSGGVAGDEEQRRSACRLGSSLLEGFRKEQFLLVDLFKPAIRAELSDKITEELLEGVEILWRFSRPIDRGPLARFVNAFRERFEDSEVPLLDALDDEVGVSYDDESPGMPSPLLEGLDLGEPPIPRLDAWAARETLLLDKLRMCAASGSEEVEVKLEDCPERSDDAPLIPPAFSVFCRILARGPSELEAGDHSIFLHSVSGPSGVRQLARFCHVEPGIENLVASHLREEEKAYPGTILAEIAHLPEGRLGNVLQRPVLRQHEIPFLGRSGAPSDFQILPSDLTVRLKGERVVLRSRSRECEVIPRLSSAHSFSDQRNVKLYRFLCMLQVQDCLGGLRWDWGPLAASGWLPRVRFKRLILSRQTWLIRRLDAAFLEERKTGRRIEMLRAWRKTARVPRLISISEFDNEILIDLENPLVVDVFCALLKSREATVLLEPCPTSEELCVKGPEGLFCAETVIPFIKERVTQQSSAGLKPGWIPSVFHPGSTWLYIKLYGGQASLDRLLRTVVPDVVQKGASLGVDRWFFVRYSDPRWHLRLRFRSDQDGRATALIQYFSELIVKKCGDDAVWRIQLESYRPETDRYGGGDAIESAERVFHADSEAVLQILAEGSGITDGPERWRVAALGVDRLLMDFGLNVSEKLQLVRRLAGEYAHEFGVQARLRHLISARYRAKRRALEEILFQSRTTGDELARLSAVFDMRSSRLTAPARLLNELDVAGKLSRPIAQIIPSFVHMHVNRVLPSAHRAHELVLYDFLARAYSSVVACQTTKDDAECPVAE